MQQMSVEDRTDGRWISLAGEWDQSDVLHHKAEFDQAVDDVSGDIIVDMSELTFLGSLGIGLMVNTVERLEKTDRKVKLSGVPSFVEQTFQVLNLSKLFERV